MTIRGLNSVFEWIDYIKSFAGKSWIGQKVYPFNPLGHPQVGSCSIKLVLQLPSLELQLPSRKLQLLWMPGGQANENHEHRSSTDPISAMLSEFSTRVWEKKPTPNFVRIFDPSKIGGEESQILQVKINPPPLGATVLQVGDNLRRAAASCFLFSRWELAWINKSRLITKFKNLKLPQIIYPPDLGTVWSLYLQGPYGSVRQDWARKGGYQLFSSSQIPNFVRTVGPSKFQDQQI